MPDYPIRGSDLRTPAPTLEPDDAFLAQLSSLAAAGANAPHGAAVPLATWRVGLAAASVAAVLVGAAWLAGLGPSGSPDPAPAPTSTPTAPEDTESSAVRSPVLDRAPEQAGASNPAPGGTPTGIHGQLPDRPGRPDQGAAEQVGPGRANGNGNGNGQNHGKGQGNGNGNGPDENAGDHPNKHATTKYNQAHQNAEDKPGQQAGGRSRR